MMSMDERKVGDVRASLASFHKTAPMIDPHFNHCCTDPANCALSSGGGRKLATHPHNIWRVLHDEQRRGEITYEELQEKLEVFDVALEELERRAKKWQRMAAANNQRWMTSTSKIYPNFRSHGAGTR